MIIQYVSDLHLEDGDKPFVDAGADVLCINGDLGVGFQGPDWVDKQLGSYDRPILIVPGNHEFYYGSLFQMIPLLKARYAEMDVEFLYNDTATIGNFKFIGTTLWTDFNLHNTQIHKMLAAPTTMTDYEVILGVNGFITPQEILNEHLIARAFIEAELASLKSGHQAVVMTHHAPHGKSLGQRATNKFAPFYASDLSSIIAKYQPSLWMHGHIHAEVEYFMGDTLVVGNPLGRVGHPNKLFAMDMTITI